MKKNLFIAIGLVLFSTVAMAESGGFSISLGVGMADPNISTYRISLKKDFGTTWFETDAGYASGYFELSYINWEQGGQNVNGVALSPVFVYYFGQLSDPVKPYAEIGIGMTYIDECRITDRTFSTHFQFEDRIGIGVKFEFFDLTARYMHYSNASVKRPNDGIDIWMLSAAVSF